MTSAKTSLKITCAAWIFDYLSRVRDVMYTENKLGLLRRKVTEKLERLQGSSSSLAISCFLVQTTKLLSFACVSTPCTPNRNHFL